MEWNYISDNKYPAQFEEVIICSNFGRVKAATYMGNHKFNTFFDVVCWTSFPEAPIKPNTETQVVESVNKKRGRPKKSSL